MLTIRVFGLPAMTPEAMSALEEDILHVLGSLKETKDEYRGRLSEFHCFFLAEKECLGPPSCILIEVVDWTLRIGGDLLHILPAVVAGVVEKRLQTLHENVPKIIAASIDNKGERYGLWSSTFSKSPIKKAA